MDNKPIRKTNISKRLLLFIIALNLTIIALATSTYAWFAEIKRTGAIMFSAGNVRYVLENPEDSLLSSDEVIKPGQELITNAEGIPIVNKSTVSTHLRMRIIVSYDKLVFDPNTSTYITTTINCEVDNSPTGDILVELRSEEGVPLWNYNDTSHYWEYLGSGNDYAIDTVHNEEGIRIDSTLYSVTSLKFNGNVVGNDTSLQNIEVNFVFQSKQAEYVSWSELTGVFGLTFVRNYKIYNLNYKIN